jgi:hypothetical protein
VVFDRVEDLVGELRERGLGEGFRGLGEIAEPVHLDAELAVLPVVGTGLSAKLLFL